MDRVFQFFITDVDGVQTLSGVAHARFEIHGLAILFFYILLQCPQNRRAASDRIVIAVGKHNTQTAVAAWLQNCVTEARPDRTALFPDDLSPVLADEV